MKNIFALGLAVWYLLRFAFHGSQLVLQACQGQVGADFVGVGPEDLFELIDGVPGIAAGFQGDGEVVTCIQGIGFEGEGLAEGPPLWNRRM